ncbi:glycosyl hydrolase [Polaribacter reichenbachii]|uniref:Glycosyl hydrolase n=1 Tax=Polaribacter reichenbachii TaxID=996801 RepID=A0A1B8TUJ0_9FLAO|nr:family 43 glycosylhydrolase [Polaribacter reichenbachii]APZ45508.1 glycosyl hydrolase [Polaribacter reichenbachii]AUC19369.1 glycosyl hydrolase [Polaribacter reichenbachii]OBY63476.1 glycosyl hydrolase [Polaribacter reichenbachii]
MKRFGQLLFLCLFVSFFSCDKQSKTDSKIQKEKIVISDEEQDFLGITNKDKLSAASKRALNWPKDATNDWYFEHKIHDLKGDLAYEEGVVRRDPSAIIKHNGLYYVWYSKSTGKTDGFIGDIEKVKVFPWDRCDIWYATSKDGITWKEEGVAVKRGEKGSYDDRSVFTVEIMEFEGMYYLCYQTVKSPYNKRVKNQVGLSWSNSPNGPWTKSKEPILSPADNGEWLGDDLQDRRSVVKKGDFDSHKVHDPCILPFKGKFYLYYKGEQMGEQVTFGGRQIRHGVAIADNPKGPYVKSPYNPISNSGHEICVWPYNGGITSLITTDGPERNTVQWSPDGINFEIKGAVKDAPHAIGLNRTADNEKEPTEILRWGLTHEYKTWDYQYIRGFTTQTKKNHGSYKEGAKKKQ